ncbi:MAG TPA: tetratricopeptide repeat protein [Candidatus Binataceae bacterium]|nr:tetratricopeptide repeat protein [Candidatus Binataceae bacterium]
MALLGLTALIFSRSLTHEFVLDDLDWIGNPYVKSWSFITRSFVNDTWWYLDPNHLPQSSYYRPFLNIWATVNFHLFGFHPSGWHATMILFYMLVVWQVFRVATLLTGNRWTGLLTATLFALMPTHAESVVWASTICQPLLATFELGAFELYLRRAASPLSDQRQTRRLAISLVLYACALLSYESAVALPLLIAAHSLLLESEENPQTTARLIDRLNSAFLAMVPYLVTLAIYLAVRFWVLGFINRPEMHDPLAPIEAMLTLPGAIGIYLMLLVIPWSAGPEHQLYVAKSFVAPEFYLPAISLAALCGAGFMLLRRHPHRRLYLYCALWFVFTLAPMLNLRGLFSESLIHDRYLYFPSVGFCLMVADLAVTFGRGGEKKATMVWIGSAAVALTYAAMLLPIENYWHDNIMLFHRCIEEAPNEAIWHYRLGRTLQTQGYFAQARPELEATIRLKPDAGGDIYYELGVVYERLGDSKSAEKMMAEGIKRVAHPPVVAYTDLAIAADAAGDAKESEAALAHAEEMPVGAAAAAVARAQILRLHGDNKGAEQVLRDLLKREPNHAQALTALGMTLSSEYRNDDALEAYRRASFLKPKDPQLHYLTALTLHRLGRDPEARHECEIAINLTMDNAEMVALLAEIDRGGGR